MNHDDYREASLTLAVALTLWAGAVAAGTSAGVFARLDEGVSLALAAFATAFASGAVLLDARVRGWLAARGAMVAWTSTFGLAVLLVGDDPASAVYVRSKERACREASAEAQSCVHRGPA